MPSKRDSVSVKIDEQKIRVQKRLLLLDIKILHNKFKEVNSNLKIGLTKFAELRPKWCVFAGQSGTHSICVCTIHQNFKAMMDAAELPRLTQNLENRLLDYKNCLKLIMCRNQNPTCYLNECKFCPDIDKFSNYVTDIFEERCVSQIIFSTWTSTDVL